MLHSLPAQPFDSFWTSSWIKRIHPIEHHPLLPTHEWIEHWDCTIQTPPKGSTQVSLTRLSGFGSGLEDEIFQSTIELAFPPGVALSSQSRPDPTNNPYDRPEFLELHSFLQSATKSASHFLNAVRQMDKAGSLQYSTVLLIHRIEPCSTESVAVLGDSTLFGALLDEINTLVRDADPRILAPSQERVVFSPSVVKDSPMLQSMLATTPHPSFGDFALVPMNEVLHYAQAAAKHTQPQTPTKQRSNPIARGMP